MLVWTIVKSTFKHQSRLRNRYWEVAQNVRAKIIKNLTDYNFAISMAFSDTVHLLQTLGASDYYSDQLDLLVVMLSNVDGSLFMLSLPHGGSLQPFSSCVDDLQPVFEFQILWSSYIMEVLILLRFGSSYKAVILTFTLRFLISFFPEECFCWEDSMKRDRQ